MFTYQNINNRIEQKQLGLG